MSDMTLTFDKADLIAEIEAAARAAHGGTLAPDATELPEPESGRDPGHPHAAEVR